jgi:hypothetical protein
MGYFEQINIMMKTMFEEYVFLENVESLLDWTESKDAQFDFP